MQKSLVSMMIFVIRRCISLILVLDRYISMPLMMIFVIRRCISLILVLDRYISIPLMDRCSFLFTHIRWHGLTSWHSACGSNDDQVDTWSIFIWTRLGSTSLCKSLTRLTSVHMQNISILLTSKVTPFTNSCPVLMLYKCSLPSCLSTLTPNNQLISSTN